MADPQVRIAMLEAALRTASRELHWANLTIQKKDAEIQFARRAAAQAAHRVSGAVERDAERFAVRVGFPRRLRLSSVLGLFNPVDRSHS
jgi:hypothetical protein